AAGGVSSATGLVGAGGASTPAAPAVATVPEVVEAGGLEAALALESGRPRLGHGWATWGMACVAGGPALAGGLRPRVGRALDVVLVAVDQPAQAAAAGKILGGAPLPGARSLLAPPAAAWTPIQRIDPGWDGALPLTLVWDGAGRQLLVQRGWTRLDELSRV